MTATSASVRFGANGVTEVESFVRLTGRTFIHCCIYDDIAPILTVKDAHVDDLDHRPRTGRGDRRRRDLRPPAGRGGGPVRGRAGAPGAPRPRGPDSYQGWPRAGGVIVMSDGAGRLELQPPAAPGFSPVASKEEVNSLCAGS